MLSKAQQELLIASSSKMSGEDYSNLTKEEHEELEYRLEMAIRQCYLLNPHKFTFKYDEKGNKKYPVENLKKRCFYHVPIQPDTPFQSVTNFKKPHFTYIERENVFKQIPTL